MKTTPIVVILFVLSFFTLFTKGVDASTVSYVHTNHQGSVVEVTDESGNPIERERYFSYGESRTPNTNNQSPVTERAYTGQIKDGVADLYYYNARYYDPSLSTFISADDVEGGNRFVYVSGNPVMYTDLTGNIIDQDAGGVGIPTTPLQPYTFNPSITAPSSIPAPGGVVGSQTTTTVPYAEARQGNPGGLLSTLGVIGAAAIAIPIALACIGPQAIACLGIFSSITASSYYSAQTVASHPVTQAVGTASLGATAISCNTGNQDACEAGFTAGLSYTYALQASASLESAIGDEMVTLYRGSSSDNAESILEKGFYSFSERGILFDNFDDAAFAASTKPNPVVIEVQVPRSMLGRDRVLRVDWTPEDAVLYNKVYSIENPLPLDLVDDMDHIYANLSYSAARLITGIERTQLRTYIPPGFIKGIHSIYQ